MSFFQLWDRKCVICEKLWHAGVCINSKASLYRKIKACNVTIWAVLGREEVVLYDDVGVASENCFFAHGGPSVRLAAAECGSETNHRWEEQGYRAGKSGLGMMYGASHRPTPTTICKITLLEMREILFR